MTALVTLDDIRDARRLLEGVIRTTPVQGSRPLTARLGGPVHLKCENLQRTGSFKLRGAYTRIARLDPDVRSAGVVAASAGNHAQGVALAAQLLGCSATIFMPTGAPLPKMEATKAYGATVRLHGSTVDEALVAAVAFATETGATFVHPFDHPDVIAGQGTCGLEILEQVPDAATVLVCTGGGGLVSGIAAAVKAQRPDVRVIGVQAADAAAFPASLAAGRPVPLGAMTTMADGIAVGCPGELTLAHVTALVDEIVTVSEDDLSRALLLCLERNKLVVEPAGVAAVAALMTQPETVQAPAVAVLSGGNIDPLLMTRVLRHGLASAGRYLSLRLRVPDSPGALAALLATLADSGANVLEVAHERLDAGLSLDEVEVRVQLETRGHEHSDAVHRHLAEAGYSVPAPG